MERQMREMESTRSVQVPDPRGSVAIWVPVLPTLPWHTRYPSFWPEESHSPILAQTGLLSLATNTINTILKINTRLLYNQQSFSPSCSSFCEIPLDVLCSFLDQACPLSDFSESIFYIKAMFSVCHSTFNLCYDLFYQSLGFFCCCFLGGFFCFVLSCVLALSTMSAFFLWLCLKTVKNIHLHFLLERL